jgi:hypothetical protein
MYRVTLQKRVVAALISFVFLFTNHFVDNVYAYENLSAITSTSFSEFPQQLDQMSLPKNIGKIEEVYQGASDQIVLLLQDAHAVPEAQRNIRNMIDYFEQHYGVKKIALEGAASKLAPQLFRSFPDKQLLKKVFNDYLEEGELTGTTMAAIFNKHESDYMGIEDWDLYERGYSFFIETMRIEADIKNQINESFYDLQKIKQKTYSPELLEIDQKLQQFSENQISLLEILKSLSSIKSPAKNSEIELLLSENSRQQTSDIPIELEVRQLAKEIQYGIDRNIQKTSARREVLASFNEKLQAFQLSEISPEEFAVILKNLTAGLGLKIKMSSNLEYLMKQHKRMKDIEGTSFFEEFEAYRESIMKQLLQTKEQIDVHEKSEELLLIKKLAILELSEKQWRELNQKPVYFFGLWDQMKAHRAFYHNAEKRDAVFSEQLQKLFKGKSLFSSSIHTEKEAIVFVSGGFHSKGLTQHLKEKNISYLLMTPSIQGMPDVINYKNHMRGLVSWKNYFEIEKGKINVFKAFVRYTRDQLLEKSSFEQGVVLKSWRDQIVRDLSDKQKIDEAKEHTKYIDELASESHQGELSEEVLTAFTEKLLALEASGRLNQQSVLRLLQPAAFSTPKNYLALASGQTLIANPRFELQAGDLVEQENGTLSIEVLPPEDGEEQTDSSIEIASIEKKKEVIRSELRNLNATEKKWLEILGEANFNAIQSDKYKYLDLISSLDVEYENDRIILEFLAKVDSEILLKAITLEGFSNSLTAASKSTLFVNTLEKHGSTLQGRLALINFPDLLMNPQRLQAMLQQDQFKGEWSFRRVWNAANLYFRTVWFNAKEWMKTTWSGLTMPVDGLLSKVSDLRKEYNDFLAILNRAEAIKLADEKRKKDWLGQAGTNFGREVGYGNIENFFLNYNVQRFAFDKPALESAQLLSGDLKNINDERLSLVLKLLKKNFPKEYRDLYERFTLNPKAGIDDLISLAKTPQSLNNLNRILSLPKSARKELNLKKLTYLINLKESELEALLKKTHVKSKASDVLIQLDQNVLSWLVSEQDQFIVDHFFQNRDRLLKLTKSLSGFYFDAHDSVTAAALASLSAENMDQIFVHIAGVSGKIAETYLKIVIKLIASHKDQKKIDAIVNALNEGALKAWSQNNADDFNKLLGLLERLSVLGDAREDLVLSVINQKGLELIVSLDEIPIHFYHSEKTADLMSVLQDKGIKLSSKTAIAIALSERMRLSAINNSDVNSGVESVPVVDYLQGKLGSKNKGGLKRLLASIEEDNQYRKRALARDILRVKAYEVVNFLKNQKILKPLTEEDKKSINQMEEGWDVAATLKYLTNKGLILGIGAAAELKGNSWVARLLTEEKKYVAFDESILSNDKILLLISLYYNVASETLDFDEKELLQRRIKHTLRQFVAKGVSVSKDFEKILTKKDYQKHQASRRDLEKTIFKPDGSVAKKGYSPDVLDKKIEIKGFVSKGLTEEEKQLQFSNNTFQIVQIAERLGLLPHNAKDEESKRKIIEIETAKIKSAENARKYFEEKIKPHRPNAVKNVLNEDKDHNTEQAEAIVDDLLFNIENILSALERLEKSQDSDASQAEEVRIVIEKNFLEEADAGRCGGSGCFNPYTGIHREMPVIHAFESNAIFASAYDSKGQRISTAVLLLTDEGVYVEKDYNGSQYALDELWLEAFKELAKVSPSIILDSTSAGRHSAIKDKLADKKTTIVKNKKITRQPSIFKDVYFDHGIPDEAGRVVIDLTDPLILTEESIRKAGGYKKSEERRQKYEDQKKRIEQASAPKSKQDAAKEEDIASQFSKLLAKEIQKLGPTAFSIAPHSLIGAVKQFIQVNGVEAISEDNELFKDLVSGKFERDSEDFNKFLALSLSVLDEITSGRSELRAGVDLEKASRAFQRLQKIISEDDFDNFTGEFLDQKRELLEAIQADIAIKNHLARLYDGSLAGWEDYQNSNEPMQELIQFHEAYELMKLKLDYDVDFNQPLNTWAKGEQQEIFLISHKEALKAESFFLALQAREQGLNAITPRLMAYTRPANFVGFYEVPRHVERDIPTMMMTFNPEDAYRPTIDELNVAINYFVNNDLMPRGHSTKHIKSMIRNKFLFNQLYQEFRNSVLFKKLGDKFYAALLFRVLNVLTQEGYDTFQDLTVEDYLTVTQNVLEKIRSHIEKASTFFDMYQLDGGGYRLLAGTDYAFEMEMQSGEFQGLRDLVMDELQELSRSELRNVDEDLTTKLDEVYNEFRRIFREQMIKDEELENSLNNPEIQEYLDEVTEDVLEGAIVSMIDIQRQVREWIKNTTKGLDYDDEFTSSITLAGIIDAHHISGEVHAFIDELIQQDSFTLAEDPMALLMRNFAEEDDTLKIDFNERLEIKKMMASYGEATSSLRLAERLADLIMQNQASLMAVYHEHQEQPFVQFRRSNRGEKLFFEILYNKLFSDEASNKISALLDGNSHALDSALERYEDEKSDRSSFDELTDRFDVGDVKQAYSISHLWNVVETWLQDFNSAARVRYVVGSFSGTQSIAEKNASDRLRDWPSIRNQLAGSKLGLAVSLMKSGENDELYYSLFLQRQIAADGIEELVIADTLSTSDGRRQVKEFIENLQAVQREIPSKIKWYSPFKNQLWKEIEARISQLADELARNVYPDIAKTIHAADLFLIQHRDTPNEPQKLLGILKSLRSELRADASEFSKQLDEMSMDPLPDGTLSEKGKALYDATIGHSVSLPSVIDSFELTEQVLRSDAGYGDFLSHQC